MDGAMISPHAAGGKDGKYFLAPTPISTLVAF